MKNKIIYNTIVIFAFLGLVACNDFLDREPLSKVTPEAYFSTENDLATYTISQYSFPTHGGWGLGTFSYDNHTDNQASAGSSNIWVPGELRVGNSGGSWDFGRIRSINYFFDKVLPKYKEGKIKGNEANIKHYIGEAYFLRAYQYFNKLKTFGDYPIVRTLLPDNKEALLEASKRRPQNEVARFILSDLDSAILLMKDAPVASKNRLSKQAALLLKSRAALYEGTWLKYHKGTARVPGGNGWPGASKVSNFTINIDSEIDFFLGEAMSAAKMVADAMPLTENNGNLTGAAVFDNPYYNMFGAIDMSGYSEIILWRDYDAKLVGHHTMHYLPNGGNSGYTKDFVDAFLMKNGKPIYASGSGYAGDDLLSTVRKDRDARLQLFMMEENDTITTTKGREFVMEKPGLFDVTEQKAVTGYNIKKGIYPNSDWLVGANTTDNGCIVFRATEAYLNYLEACYVKTGSLDGTASSYWKQLRKRAGLPEDFNTTIAATDLSQEHDWAKYSGETLVDATLYNIRRERRCEFIAEGMRMNDLRRWRALDKVSNYQVEGFKIWGPMKDWYKDEKGASVLKARPESDPNVSPESASMYLRPYQIVEANNKFFNGYNWTDAHYLTPIAFQHFLIGSSDGNADNSVIYQNPGWPIEAGGTPTGL